MKNTDKDFVLERYKYVLEQKRSLNRNTFLVVSIYQGVLALVVAANYQLWVALTDARVSVEFVSMAANGLLLLLWVVAVFSLSVLVSGVASWLGYRKEESLIEEGYLGTSRPLPRLRNAFRWYETYVAIGIIVVTTVFSFFLPSLHVYV